MQTKTQNFSEQLIGLCRVLIISIKLLLFFVVAVVVIVEGGNCLARMVVCTNTKPFMNVYKLWSIQMVIFFVGKAQVYFFFLPIYANFFIDFIGFIFIRWLLNFLLDSVGKNESERGEKGNERQQIKDNNCWKIELHIRVRSLNLTWLSIGKIQAYWF